MADRLQPRRWFFFAHDTVPPVYPVPTYRWATKPMSYQAFPAFIEGRIPVDGWQDIVRAASSMSGEYNVDHGGLIANDADGFFRALLANGDTQWFLNRQGHFLLLSEQAIRAGLLPPRILLCGRCSDMQVLDDRKAQIEIEDVLAKYLDRTYPQYTLGDAYPYRFTASEEVIADLNTIDPGLQIPRVLRNQVLCLYYGPQVETRTDPITGIAVQQRMCPVFFMGYTFLSAGTGEVGEIPPELAALMTPFGSPDGWGGWGELNVCAGDLQIPNVSVSDLSETPRPVILTEDRYGVDVIAPGHPNWPFDTNYVMRNGFLCTVIYARGPVLWHHITGICPINVDVCGWPDADGVPIDQAGFAWQSFVDQHVLAHDGAGFTSGPQTGLTMFDPTVDIDRSMIWTSKIQEFQALTARQLGTAKGKLISMGLTKPTALREIERTFNVTFDSFTAKNGAGQVYKFGIDDLADPTVGVPIRERIELLSLPAQRIDWPAMENEIDYTVGRDPKTDAPRTIAITIRDQPSIDAMKGDVRKVQGVRDLAYTADDATATDTMGRRLMRLREAPRYQPLPVRTEGVDREIGEQVRITHRDGIGPSGVGYNLRPMVLLRHVHRGDAITMEALDVDRMLRAAARWAPDDAPTWEDATPEQRLLYGYWTNDDGTIPPTGERGSEWR